MSERNQDGDEKSLKDRISKWLQDGGYPLELAIARKLRLSGFEIQQGMYLEDPVEGSAREIDIVARKNVNSAYPLRISFVIECKQSKKPFLIFKYPELAGGGFPEYTPELSSKLMNLEGIEYLNVLKESDSFKDIGFLGPYLSAGYSLTTAHFDSGHGKDFGFSAVMQAVNSSFGFAQNLAKFSEICRQDRFGGVHYVAEWVIPTVVLGGDFFEVFLSRDGEMNVVETQRALLNWFHPKVGSVWLRVVTLEAFDNFLEEVTTSLDLMESLNIDLSLGK